ncbi:NAD(P)H-binding protein [Kribbella sandramycini]|uniref:NAD(P)H-binding protein n=1 Tax=Kribbella sandramycini TaxID=60450 RepID=A0A7Y4L5Z5_9ACTN|nr:NAD(P)H-binding protein [Kribbella sandramycini]MBB6566024.1 putative NADH-flavin reductase [Kribbella sandramycini]NOL45025.1 NAD(P)H-binding protein [Kribbella sandramycini]
MSRILVVGAGGRAGGAAREEAARRGHDVTPVRRAGGGPYVAGDVTDAVRLAELAEGHDAVIAAVYDGGSDPAVFFPKAARALVDGLSTVGVGRLVWVGLASILPTADGVLLMDTEGYPNEYRPLYLAHQAALETFAASGLDWVSVAPAGDFEHDDPARVGGYRVVPASASARISYADLAIALVDEVERPEHHQVAVGVV